MTWFEELRVLAFAIGEIRSSGGSLPTFKGEPLDTWLTRAVAKIERETLPRPLFEDGEPVQFGDEILCSDGRTITVSAIEAKQSGWYSLRQFSCDALETIRPGELVKRPEPTDTWERIVVDAKKDPCAYFGYDGKPCLDGDMCPAYDTKNGNECDKCKTLDLVRRCKALAGVE